MFMAVFVPKHSLGMTSCHTHSLACLLPLSWVVVGSGSYPGVLVSPSQHWGSLHQLWGSSLALRKFHSALGSPPQLWDGPTWLWGVLTGPRSHSWPPCQSLSVLGLPGGPGAYPGRLWGSLGLEDVLKGHQGGLGPPTTEGERGDAMVVVV